MESSFSPREIVSELDKFIIGQNKAKRAVAVALRNRWRRKQLDDSLKEEIVPKNILMVGPTGCGKTEISRRLAKLANAPFIKVEATKFTEVGYVGRDVEQIIRDLVEISITKTKIQMGKEVKARAEKNAEERILDVLVSKSSTPATRDSFRSKLRSGELNDKEVEISARAIGVKGDNAGKVLSASNTYKIELPAKYVFVVNSLTSGDKDRSSYVSSVNSGLSSFNEVLVKDKNNVDIADYIIDLNFTLTVSEKETKESKEASAKSENDKMASEVFGSLLGGKDNPLGNLLQKGSEQNKQKAESLKKKVFLVDATGNMKNISNGSMITENVYLEDSLSMDASKDEQKVVAKRLVNQVLEEIGKQLASKALGKKIEKESSSSSLLD